MMYGLKRWLVVCVWMVACGVAWAGDVVVHIDVQGMTCPLCVSMINKALRETLGVVSARTSLPNREAVVVVPEGFDTAVLLAAIEQTGYSGTVRSVEVQED